MNTDIRVPWELEQRLSWPEFLAALKQYCEGRGWEIEYDTVDDFSCVVSAHPEEIGADTFVQQQFIDEIPF